MSLRIGVVLDLAQLHDHARAPRGAHDHALGGIGDLWRRRCQPHHLVVLVVLMVLGEEGKVQWQVMGGGPQVGL